MLNSEQIIGLEKKHGSFNYAPLPVVFSKGKGVYLWNPEGKKFLDFVCGYSAVSQGHSHPKIVKAIQEQAETLTLVSRALYSDQMGPFAEYATKLFGYDRILMMNTGAEAFDTGVKFARKWGYEVKNIPAGQAKIIVCQDNFHGRTMAAVSASGNEAHHKFFGPVMAGFERIPFNNLSALETALKDPNVVAFMVEPIQGEAGVNVPADGYLKKAYELCKSANALFIADEIQTGIARTGKLLCTEHDGFKPDITLLGKALSGGTLPVSGILANEDIMSLLQPGDHGSTFGGNPLACHVAIASLKVIVEENLIENAAKMGEIFRAKMKALNSPIIKEVRGKGLLNAVVFAFPAGKTDQDFSLALLDEGLVAKAAKTNVFRFAPPLVINEKQLNEGIEILASVIKKFER